MNYFLHYFIHNRKFWVVRIVIPAIAALALMDFLTYIFNPPGISNFWICRIIAILAILSVIAYGVYLYITPKREKKIIEDRAIFEERREKEFRKIIEADPGFQTFCYTCVHFNRKIKACSLDIKNQRAKKMKLSEKYTYCLYWESLGSK